MRWRQASLCVAAVLSAIPFSPRQSWAQEAVPRPPESVRAVDHPNDAGTSLDVSWELSPDDVPDADPRRVLKYEILRKEASESEFVLTGDSPFGANKFVDRRCQPGERYVYQIVAVAPDGTKSVPAESGEPATPVLQWFNRGRIWFGVILLVVCGAVVYFTEVARRGRDLKMRKIPGLEAVDEAVGRSIEMGRPCLFVPGVMDINDIQTVAGLTVLARVAQTAAEYRADVEVPTSRSLVMTAARETVQAAYLAAGNPEGYNESRIYYVTDEQFGYAAQVAGTMVREKPVACFYMGHFFAESLFLAETGNSVGAIQIAGTAESSQLPFFVAACDYTLIGEEFFAASAYLSKEPHQLGSLKGQDMGKVVAACLLISGCGLATLHMLFPRLEAVTRVLSYLQSNILG